MHVHVILSVMYMVKSCHYWHKVLVSACSGFTCYNGECIPGDLQCDGIKDCSGIYAEDENDGCSNLGNKSQGMLFMYIHALQTLHTLYSYMYLQRMLANILFSSFRRGVGPSVTMRNLCDNRRRCRWWDQNTLWRHIWILLTLHCGKDRVHFSTGFFQKGKHCLFWCLQIFHTHNRRDRDNSAFDAWWYKFW
jgi:hypothetical protein